MRASPLRWSPASARPSWSPRKWWKRCGPDRWSSIWRPSRAATASWPRRARRSSRLGWMGDLSVFVLAGFLGYQVISRVPPLLHTPLMSATNAISGILLVGSLVVAGAGYNEVSTLLGFVAVTASTINVVGGFLITDRILKMFRAGK